MAIELEKSVLSINQIIANKNETNTVEGDCIVPDIKPDVLGVIQTSGVVNVYKKEILEGKIKIDGCINIYIMYLGDDGKTRMARSLNHTLEFSQIINIDNATSDMTQMGEVVLQNIECKVINERKLNIKATLNFEVKLFSNSSTEFVNNVKLGDIQKLEKTYNVNSMVGSGRTKANAKETIQIDKSDNLVEILKVNAYICNKDIKISYNKVLAKSEVKIKMLYSTDDGRINSLTKTMPIVGFIDIQDISENNVLDSEFEINNMIIKPNSTQDYSIYAEVEVGMQVIAYDTKPINVIQDLYSPSKNLNYEQKIIRTIQNKNLYKDVYTIRQKEMLELADEKVYDVDVNVVTNNVKVYNGETQIGGTVICMFTHSINKMTGISIKKLEIPFEYKMTTAGTVQDAVAEIKTDITTQDFNIMPDGSVDINIDIQFIVSSSNDISINLINNITEAENNNINNYNMVIYFTKAEDDLWGLAKRFRSKKDMIMS